MALACNPLQSIEYSSSSSCQKANRCKLFSWPFSQVAPLASFSNHHKRPQRSYPLACSGRETLVSQLEEAVPTSLPVNRRQGAFLAQDGATQGGHEVDFLQSEKASQREFLSESPFSSQATAPEEDGSASPFMKVSQSSSQVSLREDEQVEVQVRDDDGEEEWLKGFPGAKGAVVKPLTASALAWFPEDYLDTVTSIDRWDWVTVVPLPMLPKGDRLVIDHNRESVILFWFKDRIYALENRSPAAPMFEEGFAKAVITEDGLITCPITGSTFDISTGTAVEWLPKSSFLDRLFTPVLNDLSIYAVKASPEHIFVEKKRLLVGGYYPLAEFTGNRIWEGPNYEEPIIFDDLEFGFTDENELTNGRFAMLGFLTLLLLEMTTGNGILKGSGILDFLYKFLPGFPVLKY